MSSGPKLTHPITDAPLWNSDQHHGPVVSVVTWILIIAVVLAVTARTVTRYALIHSLRWDDITALLAMASAIGQTVAVSIQATNGLGSPIKSLTTSEMIRFQKSNYANNFLSVVTLGLAKVSVSLHVYGLSPIRYQQALSLGVGGFSALWASTSLLVAAFECKVPLVWKIFSGQCINLLAFWTYFVVLNIITDLALIGLPVPIILRLQVSAGKKAVILSCFATRLSVVAASIIQLCYLPRSASADPTYDTWIPVLCAQVVVSFSLISACVPFLKFLIDALETGLVRADGRRAGATSKVGSSGEGAYYRAQGSNFKSPPFSGTSYRLGHVNRTSALRMESLNGETASQGNRLQNVATKGSRTEDDLDSQSSQTHIMRRVEWTLTEETTGVQRV